MLSNELLLPTRSSTPSLEPSRERNQTPHAHHATNDLVRRLPQASRTRLVELCDQVTLRPRQLLQERNLPLQHAYFLENGAASLTAKAGDCLPVEIQTVGAKDFIGIPLILGMRVSPHRCMVQVSGRALRIEADALIELVRGMSRSRSCC
ncbi:hypothetical protein IVB38_06190 [Bradyrhizobium sp. 38]|uniref:hypothetical protein n=1 Tax=unclassified Bradyrhizobium TaxID=2631580 RepID=UPI001FF96974|nr:MULTISPECIES: hypothetical protein [unclassified Bradyrhizobium]MCK1335630.1 hypothetical protein [Bradyrhizobium sp. 38]MCK1778130.1 hypothetical protein [Bradyrhizobium sp. 132]